MLKNKKLKEKKKSNQNIKKRKNFIELFELAETSEGKRRQLSNIFFFYFYFPFEDIYLRVNRVKNCVCGEEASGTDGYSPC